MLRGIGQKVGQPKGSERNLIKMYSQDKIDVALKVFRQYENGVITFESMLSGIIYKKTTNQYSFHTQKAINLLRKVGS